MSRSSQQRRAAKKKKQQKRTSGGHRPEGQETHQAHRGAQDENVNISELIRDGSVYAVGPSHDQDALTDVIREVLILEQKGHAVLVRRDAARVLDWAVDEAFLNGWQPSEFLHALARDLDKLGMYLAFETLRSHSRRTSARAKAPGDWLRQLDELGVDDGERSISSVVDTLRTRPTTDPTVFWTLLLTVIGSIRYLQSMTPLMAIPSEWDVPIVRTSAPRKDTKVLNTIRNLLAKAEATTYAAEAEALSAKAQDLMTRYAIDSAVLEAKRHISLSDEVETRRFLIDNPYPEAKVSLVQAVSDANAAKVIWFKHYGLVSVVGMPVDLDLVELLFTSLLVQSAHALAEAGRDRASRSPSFRRSFLLAYASRIGERLTEARERAAAEATVTYGSALVPIMTERDEAVNAAFAEQFPKMSSTSQSVSNPHGWAAGREAADGADITGGRERIDRSRR